MTDPAATEVAASTNSLRRPSFPSAPSADALGLGPGDERGAPQGRAIALGARLLPTLTSQYQRTTLVDLDAVARLTIDTDLLYTDWTGADVALADQVVVETKSTGTPSAIDRWLWRNGTGPEKISKFGTALAALHPDPPSNKWHRTLRRLFS